MRTPWMLLIAAVACSSSSTTHDRPVPTAAAAPADAATLPAEASVDEPPLAAWTRIDGWSPDGRWLSVDRRYSIDVWSVDPLRKAWSFPNPKSRAALSLRFVDGRNVLVRGETFFEIRDVASGNLVSRFDLPAITDRIQVRVLQRRGMVVLTSGTEGHGLSLVAAPLADLSKARAIAGPWDDATILAVDPGERTILVDITPHALVLLDIDGKQLGRSGADAEFARFVPDGTAVLLYSDGEVSYRELPALRERWHTHVDSFDTIAATASRIELRSDVNVQTLDRRSGKIVADESRTHSDERCLDDRTSPDGRSVASIVDDLPHIEAMQPPCRRDR